MIANFLGNFPYCWVKEELLYSLHKAEAFLLSWLYLMVCLYSWYYYSEYKRKKTDLSEYYIVWI